MNKTIAIHQPNLFPWSGYFHKIIQSDVFVFLDNVDIEINTSKAITTRCKIKTANGEQWLTIPYKKGETKTIKQLFYMDNNWREKTLRTITMSYSKTPFFRKVLPLVEEIVFFPSNNIAKYNINAILRICDYLKINNCEFITASDIEIESVDRNGRIIEICKKCNATQYFSGRGGKNYHDESVFFEEGISIVYTNYVQTPYKQLYGGYIPGLSVLDTLFNKNEI